MLAVSHEDLSSDTQILHKKPHTRTMPCAFNFSGSGAETERSLGLLARQASWIGLGSVIELASKTKKKESHTYVHMCNSEQIQHRNPKCGSSTPYVKLFYETRESSPCRMTGYMIMKVCSHIHIPTPSRYWLLQRRLTVFWVDESLQLWPAGENSQTALGLGWSVILSLWSFRLSAPFSKEQWLPKVISTWYRS